MLPNSYRNQARKLWIRERGPIPPGYHIHHKDRDPSNNALDNLECLSPIAHVHLHPQTRKPRKCLVCHCLMLAQWRQRFCSNNCKAQWRRQQHLDDVDLQCARCGRYFRASKYEGRQYCSRECGNGHYVRPFTSCVCRHCGEVFLGGPGAFWCSTRCRKRAYRVAALNSAHVSTHHDS